MNKPISINTQPPNRKERRKKLQVEQPAANEAIQEHSLTPIASPVTLIVKKVSTSLLFWLIFSITVGSFLFLAYPRVSVYPDKTLNPDDPFQTPFILENNGYLPIHDIHYSLSLENIGFGQGNTLPHAYSGIDETSIPRLAHGRSSTIPLKSFIDLLRQSFGIFLPPKAITSAEIYIDVSYRSYLIPYNFTDHVGFKAGISSSGNYVWSEYQSK
jgi:hypothetical protein